MTTPFVHLHLHTQYSLLDGANKIPLIIGQANALGQPAIAITDHGNMHGAIEFYLAAKKAGIKPIVGCELYVTSGSRFERKVRAQGGAQTYHLTVLAQDIAGYRNLCRLVSLANQEGFYFKPRVDHEILRQYSQGIVALSGCLSGELNGFISLDDIKRGRELIQEYAAIFKDRFYLEIQPHAIVEQQKLNQACVELAKDLGVPLAATNDCHYPHVDDHYAQEVLMCISTGKLISDPTRMQHAGVQLHLKSGEDMARELLAFTSASEAISNTLEIAQRCNLEFNFNTYYMPKFSARDGDNLFELMAGSARSGLEKRLVEVALREGKAIDGLRGQYCARLEEELAMIEKMGFSGYFLVVADFIVWAKEQGIPVGPGRGSVAGSLVAYAMRITEIDPISNKLLFERFLNPDRVSLPDIDVDFCIFGRDRVIKYVVDKYGKDRVAQIVTFGTLKAKAAIKDVGRVLGLSYAETDRIAQLVPAPRQGFDYSLEEALKMEPKLADYARGEGQELVSLAMKLEGAVRHTSTHAAGVVIGDRPLIDLLPMMVDKDGNDVTQFSMSYVEKIGLVKFDFLGLKTLTVIHTALRLIKESKGVDIALDSLPLADPKTYALLCSGNTTGVFQLESGGITDMTKRLKPSCFDDLTAILALFRPGPLDAGMVDHYIDRKHGKEPVVYLHPLMRGTLSDTYGIILYQEQIMQLARDLAEYSLGDADLLRRAMGKKNPEEMAKQRDIFVTRAVKKGVESRLASQIFDQMETFARYGFNRSHSAAYAMISFQTAYLKAHFPVEFMAALMSLDTEDSDKILKNLNECRDQKITVLAPQVNESVASFTVQDGVIRYGLEAVKGIGAKAVQEILKARAQAGPFKDLEDFVTRVDIHALNRRVVESLIKSGAFDFTGLSRRELMERLEEVLRAGQALQREKDSNQIGLFAAGGAERTIPRRVTNRPEWPVNQRLAFEREALGFFISGHPLEKFRKELKRIGVKNSAELKDMGSSKQARVAGVVTALRLKNTKKGDRYATFTLEDWQGTTETIVWPDVYRQVAHIIVAEDPVVVSGNLDVGNERRTFIADKIESLNDIRERNAKLGMMELKSEDCDQSSLRSLVSIFEKYPGNCPVKVNVQEVAKPVQLRDRHNAPICVAPSERLCEEIEQLFGRPVLSFIS